MSVCAPFSASVSVLLLALFVLFVPTVLFAQFGSMAADSILFKLDHDDERVLTAVNSITEESDVLVFGLGCLKVLSGCCGLQRSLLAEVVKEYTRLPLG